MKRIIRYLIIALIHYLAIGAFLFIIDNQNRSYLQVVAWPYTAYMSTNELIESLSSYDAGSGLGDLEKFLGPSEKAKNMILIRLFGQIIITIISILVVAYFIEFGINRRKKKKENMEKVK